MPLLLGAPSPLDKYLLVDTVHLHTVQYTNGRTPYFYEADSYSVLSQYMY